MNTLQQTLIIISTMISIISIWDKRSFFFRFRYPFMDIFIIVLIIIMLTTPIEIDLSKRMVLCLLVSDIFICIFKFTLFIRMWIYHLFEKDIDNIRKLIFSNLSKWLEYSLYLLSPITLIYIFFDQIVNVAFKLPIIERINVMYQVMLQKNWVSFFASSVIVILGILMQNIYSKSMNTN